MVCNRKMPTKVKLKAYKTEIRPVLSYRSVIWPWQRKIGKSRVKNAKKDLVCLT